MADESHDAPPARVGRKRRFLPARYNAARELDGRYKRVDRPRSKIPPVRTLQRLYIESSVLKLYSLPIGWREMTDMISRSLMGDVVSGLDPVGVPGTKWAHLPPRPAMRPLESSRSYKAWRHVFELQPRETANEMRAIRTAQLERMALKLAPKVARGDPSAVRASVVALHECNLINGLITTKVQVDDAVSPLIMLRRLAEEGRALINADDVDDAIEVANTKRLPAPPSDGDEQ